MKDKKHIDQLFQERFQKMETTPPPAVWNAIEKQLDAKKKDRKVIPLWWRASGVAALLLLALFVGGRLFISSEILETNTQIVEQTTINTDTDIVKTPTAPNTSPESVSIENNTVVSKELVTSTFKTNTEQAALPSNSKTQVASQNSNKVESIVSTPTNKTTSDGNIKIDVATQKGIASVVEKDIFIENETSKITIVTTKVEDKKEQTIETQKDPGSTITQMEAIASQETKNTKETKEAQDAEVNKPSILDAIKEQEDAVVALPKSQKRWEVMPTLAPVYYNSLSEGSSIDPTFADNSQSGDVNLSYGLQVSYAINDRLKIRTGIANVNVGYSTGDLDLATGDVTAALQTINYGTNGIVTTAVDQGAIAQATPGTPFSNLEQKATAGEVLLTQNINYLEIPTELTYSLLNKKVSLNVIGGFSTLFLGNNDVSVASDDFQAELGEANNLTEVSFSTNVGLGMRYSFSKRFSFNVEPIFKYQLNPYTNSAVSFQPYYLGVYSGLSFRF